MAAVEGLAALLSMCLRKLLQAHFRCGLGVELLKPPHQLGGTLAFRVERPRGEF